MNAKLARALADETISRLPNTVNWTDHLVVRSVVFDKIVIK